MQRVCGIDVTFVYNDVKMERSTHMKKFIYCLTILCVLCFCGCGQTQEGVKESAQKNVEDTKDTHEGTEGSKEAVDTTPVPGRIEIRRLKKS
jgi:hypothetical protein